MKIDTQNLVGTENLELKNNGDANFIMFNVKNDLSIDNLKGAYEYLEPFYRKYSDPNKCAIDVGAFVGSHTIILSKLYKKVFSFEPQLNNFLNVCANLYINKITNVLPLHMGCYNKKTTIKLSDYQTAETKFDSNGIFDYWGTPTAPCLAFTESPNGNVAAVALDDIINEPVAFIKIDAQGSDLKVLQGARRIISTYRPVIIFEFEHVLAKNIHNEEFSSYQNFFDELKYTITNVATSDYICIP